MNIEVNRIKHYSGQTSSPAATSSPAPEIKKEVEIQNENEIISLPTIEEIPQSPEIPEIPGIPGSEPNYEEITMPDQPIYENKKNISDHKLFGGGRNGRNNEKNQSMSFGTMLLFAGMGAGLLSKLL